MKTVIVYSSNHHGNTLKLVKAIYAKYNVTIIDLDQEKELNLMEYDLIGFASGIAYNRMYKCISKAISNNLPKKKKVFFLYTCGKNNKDFTKYEQELAKSMECEVLGSYGCIGYNTYGPLKLIGGINKGHPDEKEIDGALNFFEKITMN